MAGFILGLTGSILYFDIEPLLFTSVLKFASFTHVVLSDHVQEWVTELQTQRAYTPCGLFLLHQLFNMLSYCFTLQRSFSDDSGHVCTYRKCVTDTFRNIGSFSLGHAAAFGATSTNILETVDYSIRNFFPELVVIHLGKQV